MEKGKWMVQIPIDEIIALYGAIEENDRTKAENAQLRREIDGLRNVQNECLLLLGDLRRQIKNSQPKG